MVSTEVQTENWCDDCGKPVRHKCDLPPSPPIAIEHAYALKSLPSKPAYHSTPVVTPCVSPVKDRDSLCSSFNLLSDYSIGRNGEVIEESSSSEDESGQSDASYNVGNDTESFLSEVLQTSQDNGLEDGYVDEKKYLVFDSNLDSLFYKIRCTKERDASGLECSAPVAEIKKTSAWNLSFC